MAPGIAFAAALAAAFIGIHYGTYTAGDSDPYGYVSEADLIARGSLRVEQQFARTMPWPLPEWTFAPLGYRPAPEHGFIVPTYPAGLPIVMALFERARGPAGVFYAVPLLGALAILATWRLGAALYGEAAGIMSAALLASSPTFLLQLIQPVSDVPAAAWWALRLALVVSYLFSIPSGRDDVAYLRFLLPAYPALVVLSVGAAMELAMRFGVRRATLVAAGVCAIVGAVNVRTAAARHVLALRDYESRYVDLGRYVAQATPQNALF